jgi:hypothetical protein
MNHEFITRIPDDLNVPELWALALMRDRDLLQSLPMHLRTSEFYLELLKFGGIDISNIPTNVLTPEFYLIAAPSLYSLRLILEHERTPEITRAYNISHLQEFIRSNNETCTQELCFAAILKDPTQFRHVPFYLQTSEMYRAAVIRHKPNLEYVPEQSCTSELCTIAVKHCGKLMKWVPEHLATFELCMIAVNGKCSLKYIPEHFRTAEICLIAIKYDLASLKYIPMAIFTPTFCFEIVKFHGSCLYVIPLYMRTSELCHMAVQTCGMSLEYVPDNIFTTELCITAIKNDPKAFVHVPKKLRTLELAALTAKHTMHKRAVFDAMSEIKDSKQLFQFATLGSKGFVNTGNLSWIKLDVTESVPYSIHLVISTRNESEHNSVIVGQCSVELIINMLNYDEYFAVEKSQEKWYLHLLNVSESVSRHLVPMYAFNHSSPVLFPVQPSPCLWLSWQ